MAGPKSTPRCRALLARAGVLGLGLVALPRAARAYVLYDDTFNRGTGGAPAQLAGSAPTVNPTYATWSAGAGLVTNGAGAVENASYQNATLPIDPVYGDNDVFTLQATITPTGGSASDWTALGFSGGETASGGWMASGNDPLAWLLLRTNGGTQSSYGGGTANLANGPTVSASAATTFTETLNDDTGVVTLADGAGVFRTVTLTSAQVDAIKVVGFGNYNTARSTVQDFSVQATLPQAMSPVVMGGTINETDLLTAANSATYRALGGGLYLHNTGWGELTTAQKAQVMQVFAGTGAQHIEFGFNDNPSAWSSLYTSSYLPAGVRAVDASVNLPAFTQSANPTQAQWVAYVQDMRAVGVPIVEPVFSPNASATQANPGWNDASFQYIRDYATYGGGLTIDSPADYYNQQVAGPHYQTFVQNEIEWANTNGLHSTWIISPYFQPSTTFLADTQAAVRSMENAGAIPQQYVVENYEPYPQPPTYTNNIGSEDTPNTVLNVAVWMLNHVQGIPHTLQVSGTASGTTPVGKSTITTTATGYTQTVAVGTSGLKPLTYSLTLNNSSGTSTGNMFYIPEVVGQTGGDAADWSVALTLGSQDISSQVLGGGYTMYSTAQYLPAGSSETLTLTLTPRDAQADAAAFDFMLDVKAHPDATADITSFEVDVNDTLPAPEPSSFALLSVAAATLVGRRGRRCR
jgi:hypothetical protein